MGVERAAAVGPLPVRVREESFGYEVFSGRSVLQDVNGTRHLLCRHIRETSNPSPGFEVAAEKR